MIVLRNVTVSYRGFPAVHHVSVSFAAGESWAICGPNGAGKSTLLKAVMGLEKIDTGHILFEGMTRRDIAYLPQASEIDRSRALTVFELAAMGLWHEIGFFKGLNREREARVNEALRRVGMEDYRRRFIGELSEGQFRRVLFARMLTQNARFLLADEPFNAIDEETARALLRLLNDCRAEGRGVIAVLHDENMVRRNFSRTLLLARETVAAGVTDEVLSDANLSRASAFRRDLIDPHAWCPEDRK